jgi:hypothetical protein
VGLPLPPLLPPIPLLTSPQLYSLLCSGVGYGKPPGHITSSTTCLGANVFKKRTCLPLGGDYCGVILWCSCLGVAQGVGWGAGLRWVPCSYHCHNHLEGLEGSSLTVPDSGPVGRYLCRPVREWGLKCWPGEGEIGGMIGVVGCGISPMSTCLGSW